MTPAELEQVEEAKEALPKATPGTWIAELCLGGSYVIDNDLPESRGKVRRIAIVDGLLATPYNAKVLAAAPVLVERVIELEAELAALKELSTAKDEYIALLERASGEAASKAYIHGWTVPQKDIDAGVRCREKIASLAALIAQAQKVK